MLGKNFYKMVLALKTSPLLCSQFKRLFSTKVKERVVYSGIQPTGVPHIGNYLGAIKNWVQLQDTPGKHIYCVVDLHSLTVPKSRDELISNTYEMLACLLACGLDPNKSILYKQSDVPEHTQLAWIFSSLVSTVRLNRFPQWKEKSMQLGDTHGLFSYPVLQASDILLFNTSHVPVGEDQATHIHLVNEVAEKFNKTYGETFNHIEILSDDHCSRVLNLKDASGKMSKSARSRHSQILLTDTDEEIWMKIRRAITDHRSEVSYDPETRPGVSNLIGIHSGFSGMSTTEICEKAAGLNTGQYKMAVAECVIDALRPIRDQYERLRADSAHLDHVFRAGGEQAREIAAATWSEVREKVGLLTSLKTPLSSLKNAEKR